MNRKSKSNIVSHFTYKILLIYLFLLVGISSFSLFGATSLDTKSIFLNTSVEAASEFYLTDLNNAPLGNNVSVALGQTYSNIRYHFSYSGSNQIKVTISSSNYGSNSMRMKHDGANLYIPYTMRFDYNGQASGGMSNVTHGVAKDLSKVSGSYADVYGNIEIIPTAGSYISGSYSDTITINITGL